MNKEHILSKPLQFFLGLISLFIVAFGQPARSLFLCVFAASIGYALFWRVLLCYESNKKRFYLSAIWFTGVQLIQLSWMISHPFYYILGPYFIFSALQGIQFGLLGLFITVENISRIIKILSIAAFWVLMEWSRLFFLSGYSWNPSGMALAGNLYSLQMASFFGVYGLSFWVILVNLLLLKCFLEYKSNLKIIASAGLFTIASLTPYIYGAIHLSIHESKSFDEKESFNAVLVQPSFAVEGMDHIYDRKVLIAYVMEQWKQILLITKKQQTKKIDLIVLPEYVVPFGTYTSVFPLETVKQIFTEVFGEKILEKMPSLDEHLIQQFQKSQKESTESTITFVNNAFWLQAFANVFDAPIVAGLEDVDDIALGKRQHYSAALYFFPACTSCAIPERYEKRVLVPLGEYIPFSFCRQLAISYGVEGSFTKGEKAKVFFHPKKPFGVSICYEETFGHVMRENKQNGAEILVNLTNDGWFPNSTLTKQHFDHARLRSVECGIPLIRACNTGITGGFDSLGRVVSVLGDLNKNFETVSDSLFIQMPTYNYQTLYSKFGDHLILVFSGLALFGLLLPSRKP